MVGLEKNEIEWAVLGAWDVIVKGAAKEKRKNKVLNIESNKWKIESRSKLKSIGIALFAHEDPSAGITHFVKYAEYMLPRSDLNETLYKLLEKVGEAREKQKDAGKAREMISNLVGYLCWSLDAFCKVLDDVNAYEDVNRARAPLTSMLKAEFSGLSVSGKDEKIKSYVDELLKWAEEVRRKHLERR